MEQSWALACSQLKSKCHWSEHLSKIDDSKVLEWDRCIKVSDICLVMRFRTKKSTQLEWCSGG